MGLEFLQEYGGQRLRFPPHHIDFGGSDEFDSSEDDQDPELKIDCSFEVWSEAWEPIDVLRSAGANHLLPIRFIDGCHSGQTVAWVQAPQGHPVPVMLAEVGGIAMTQAGRQLRREFEIVERVVTMVIQPFPWHQIEAFAVALQALGLRLLPAEPPKDEQDQPIASFDFELMRRRTQTRSHYEMEALEELALHQCPHQPSLIDGRLEPRVHGFAPETPVVGLIKQHREDYLHEQGWRTFYSLEPGQRTPAFRIDSRNLPVVSWYLRLAAVHGAIPTFGIVRVEITHAFHESLPDPTAYIDALSAWLVEIRCRQANYDRAPISLEPIVRAEESLKSLFSPPDYLKSWFYRQTEL